MVNTRDRSITHNVAKMTFDQILNLIVAGVCFNITCDLNLLKNLPFPPLFFFFPRSLLLKRPTSYRDPPE